VTRKRLGLKFYGIVQGVGFRPFIYRTARARNLAGFVKNLSDSVLVEIEGDESAIEHFLDSLDTHLPPLAVIERATRKELPLQQDTTFKIEASEKSAAIPVHISPDIATCDDCLAELFDPDDRRYLYPFINCTNCGPRFTIIYDIPYDRENTTMAVFEMCEACRKEYEDPLNRRFHAEPIACPHCGPRLALLNRDGTGIKTQDPLAQCAERLARGEILAIKGLGGFHLAADATRADVVAKLRERKRRGEKAFALMVRNLEDIEKIAHVGETEWEILTSPQCPIVLLRKKRNRIIADNVAPGLAAYGIMLPYTPLHHLLLDKIPYLIMTSGNQRDEPICIANREALTNLGGIADAFLTHDRGIRLRCDDSIAMSLNGKMTILRRSRGFAPAPLKLHKKFDPPVLALGAHLKNTICLLKDDFAFLSPHIGDLETPKARDYLRQSIRLMEKITETTPGIVACDLHPSYFTHRLAEDLAGERNIPWINVQHHHAHVVSCMAEKGIKDYVIGFSFDGTGYGLDGKIWGGETLIADTKNFERVYHLRNFPLAGGERAIQEPWRIGLALLMDSLPEDWEGNAVKLGLAEPGALAPVASVLQKRLNTVEASSMGRLFDGVSAILGCRKVISYEGQGAMELEAICQKSTGVSLHFSRSGNEFDYRPLIRDIVDLKLSGESAGKIAYAFHRAIADLVRDTAQRIRDERKLDRVVLTGGCFQNKILTELSSRLLRSEGFTVLAHENIPCNDGGISLGQAVIAAEKGEWNGNGR